VQVSIAVQLVALLAWFSLMCCAGEMLKRCPDLFAVKYVIMMKYRKYPIDDQVFVDTEVCGFLHCVDVWCISSTAAGKTLEG